MSMSARSRPARGTRPRYIQLTSQRLGIDGEKIRVRQGDTDTIPIGGGTGGSRSLYSEGQAILLTADSVIDKGKQAAADVLEAAPADIAFADGSFSIVGTDRGIDIITLATTQRQKARGGRAGDHAGCGRGGDVAEHTFPNGCHMAEVEVDPETGVVEIVRYRVCDDFGKTVNPMIVRGQVHGGVAQGLGQAVLERTSYDATRASCCPAVSWTTHCRARTTCRTSRSICWKCPACPTLSA